MALAALNIAFSEVPRDSAKQASLMALAALNILRDLKKIRAIRAIRVRNKRNMSLQSFSMLRVNSLILKFLNILFVQSVRFVFEKDNSPILQFLTV